MVIAGRHEVDVIAQIVRQRTGNQVRGLEVEIWPRCVVLHGHAESYYIKQLAQHDLRQQLPAEIALENLIVVSKGERPTIHYIDAQSSVRRTQSNRPLLVSGPSRLPVADFAVA